MGTTSSHTPPPPVHSKSFTKPLAIGVIGIALDVTILAAFEAYARSSLVRDPAVFDIAPEMRALNWYLGVFLLCYMTVVFSLRASMVGQPYVLYDMLWGCNVTPIIAAYGAMTGRSLFIGIAIIHVASDQMSWYIDFTAKALTGKWLVGVASYMTEPISIVVKLTSLHHLWFLPFCLFMLRGSGIPPYTFYGTGIAVCFAMTYARATTPYKVISGHKDPKTDKPVVMEVNINLCYAFYPAIQFPIVHALDHYPPYMYIPYVWALANFVINGPFYLALVWYSDNYLKYQPAVEVI